ncbi:MAG TPA: radical SAM protein [Chitinispirillaceae bacterium]|nr:radical SAM protein [Chitinispirillaceae bacterium]
MTESIVLSGKHPCFNPEARHSHARIHLPVAPRCNVQCNFCNRLFSCANESRPGVSASVISPTQALKTLKSALRSGIPISVAGIAGPGDAFANVKETLDTLRLIHEHFPEILLCVSTNGVDIAPYVDVLEDLGVSHLTVTVNAIDAETAARLYTWVRVEGETLKGLEAGQVIVERQRTALQTIATHSFILKVNTVVVPGVNMDQVPIIAKTVADLGADLHNCIPMIPVTATPFAEIEEPLSEQMQRIQALAGAYIPQMFHCNRCRADACGFLTEKGML